MRIAELCAGYGGIQMGLALAGIDHQLAWYAETDPAASAVMQAHHPHAPNLGDLRDITNPEPVDIITAGFPCQPVSVSGRREGVNDERWIIDDVCRVARTAGAGILILENVAGLLTGNGGDALSAVCAAMAREGFSRWEWGTIRASDVGAPHGRKRWFCIAVSGSVGSGRDGWTREAGRVEGGRSDREPSRPSGRSSSAATDTVSHGLSVKRISGLRQDSDTLPRGDTDRCLRERFGGYAEAVDRWERTLGRPAPRPARDGRLNPRFVEWMMGLPEGHVTGHGLKRADELRILGNGVVPLQCAAAMRMLGLPTALTETAAA